MAALIGGGASLLGGALSQGASAKSVHQNMVFQDQQAKRQMDFQERMAGSAHQREVSDLRAAGLNPLLSGTGGMGSASPQGASATGGTYQGVNYLGQGVSSALEARRNKADVDIAVQTRRRTSHEADDAENRAAISDFERRVVDAQVHNYKDNGVDVEAQRRIAEARASNTAADLERGLDESSGELLRTLKRLGLNAGTAAQLFSITRPRSGGITIRK